MLAVVAAAGLAAGTWLLARVPRPEPVAGRPPEPSARVSVVVPARDEAASLPRLLGSLRALARPPHEVLVVDDGSRDDTAGIARRLGATVLDAGPLPDGWSGKPWACHVGAGAATGTHLLFLDADTWLAPDALDRLLGAVPPGGGLLSVQPYHVTVRPYEELSAYCNAVSMMGSGEFAARRGPGRPVAFGPCLLTSVADHRRAGGHGAVRGEVVEDVHLARAYRRAGLPVRCLAGGGTVRFRMYPLGVGQLVEGWTKNIAAGASLAAPLPVAGAVLWVAAHAAVATATVVGTVRWATGGPAPVAAWAGWAAVAVHLRWVLARIGSFRIWTAVAFPVPLAAFVALFARSAVLTLARRGARWRGRRVGTGTRQTP